MVFTQDTFAVSNYYYIMVLLCAIITSATPATRVLCKVIIGYNTGFHRLLYFLNFLCADLSKSHVPIHRNHSN